MSWANARWLLAVIAVTYLAASYTRFSLLYYLTYTLAGVFIISLFWALSGTRSVSIVRKKPADHARVGDVFRESLRFENKNYLPKQAIEVIDYSDLPGHSSSVGAIVNAGPAQVKHWHAETECDRRGRFTIGPLSIGSSDPFGLFRFERRLVGTSKLVVYPPVVEIPGFAFPVGSMPGGDRTKRETIHVTPNATGIRGYVPGDSLNRISWRATAKYRQLMVKEFELDPLADTWVVLDMCRDDHLSLAGKSRISSAEPVMIDNSSEEYSVTLAASLSALLLSKSYPVGLVSWAQHLETLPPDRGARQMKKILESLAVIRAEGRNTIGEVLAAESMRFGRNCSLVIITGATHEEWLPTLQECMMRGTRAAVMLVDLSSFGGRSNSLAMVGSLAMMDVPTQVVRKGDLFDNIFTNGPLRTRA